MPGSQKPFDKTFELITIVNNNAKYFITKTPFLIQRHFLFAGKF